MRLRSAAIALAIAVLGFAVSPASAAALEPGVFISPGSPAGKEYSFPLSALRGQAVGRPAVGGQAEPLFGIGIGSSGAASATNATRTTSAGRTGSQLGARRLRGQRAANSAGRGAGAAGRGAGTGQVSREELASLVHQGSTVPQMALWGGLVLLGGLAIGGLLVIATRRRSS